MRKSNTAIIEKKKSWNVPTILIVVLVVISVVTSILAFSNSLRVPRIGYVKTGEVVSSFQGTKEAQQLLEQMHRQWQANIDTLERQYNYALSQYNSNTSGLSKSEKVKQEDYLLQQGQLKDKYTQGIQIRAQQEQQRLMDSVVGRVNSFIKDYAVAEGYDYIFGTTSDGSLLYGKEADDVTRIIIEVLNKKYKKGSIFDTAKVR